MATIYDSMALKTVTNQAQSGVNMPIVLDCWFEEGAITVGLVKTISNGNVMLDRPLYTWASRVDFADNPQAPDWVTPATTNSEYTYLKLQGKPILALNTSRASGTSNVVGVLGSDLKGPVSLPVDTAAADSVAKRVAGFYLRHGQVTLLGCAYYPVAVDAGTTDIAVGDHLVYNRGTALWTKETTTYLSPVIACHVATEATGQYVGALFYGCPNAEA